MACFIVPAATAVVMTAVEKAEEKKDVKAEVKAAAVKAGEKVAETVKAVPEKAAKAAGAAKEAAAKATKAVKAPKAVKKDIDALPSRLLSVIPESSGSYGLVSLIIVPSRSSTIRFA